ncbi:TRAP transporter substrate-binding protein [Cellulomonas sp. P5_C6]
MTRGDPLRLLLALVVVVAPLVAACDPQPETKAGAGALPVTLTIGTAEDRTPSYAPDVTAFAEEVARLSDGAVQVDIQWQAVPYGPGSEAELARRVRDGSLDLGWVPTRALGGVGEHRFEALSAPFVVDSNEVADAVASSPLAADMLADLDDHGLVGLALVVEGLRHPVAYGDPLLTPDDFRGLRIRTADDDVAQQIYTSLGAVPGVAAGYSTDSDGTPFAAADSGFEWAVVLPENVTYTANITPTAKFDAIVAGSARFAGLTAAQRDVVRRAAATVRDTAPTRRTSQARRAELVCGTGSHVVLADPRDAAAIASAADPVRDRIATLPDGAADLAALARLKRSTPAHPFELPAACGPQTGDGAPLKQPTVSP